MEKKTAQVLIYHENTTDQWQNMADWYLTEEQYKKVMEQVEQLGAFIMSLTAQQ